MPNQDYPQQLSNSPTGEDDLLTILQQAQGGGMDAGGMSPQVAAPTPGPTPDPTEISLEDLLRRKVTSGITHSRPGDREDILQQLLGGRDADNWKIKRGVMGSIGNNTKNILQSVLLGRNFTREADTAYEDKLAALKSGEDFNKDEKLSAVKEENNRLRGEDITRKQNEGAGRLISALEKGGTRLRINKGESIPEGWEVSEDILGDPNKQTITNTRAGKVLVNKEMSEATKGMLKDGTWVDKATVELLKTVMPKPVTGTSAGRVIGHVTREDGIKGVSRGEVYKDRDGKVLDPSLLGPMQVLVRMGDGSYAFDNQKLATTRANNLVMGRNPYGQEINNVYGVGNVNRSSVPAGFDAAGNYHSGETTYATGGVPGQTSPGSGSAVSAQAAKVPRVPTSPTASPSVGAQTPSQPGVPSAPAIPSGPKPGRWSGAQYQKSREAYRPLHLLGSMVFGSDENPNSKPLSAYADIFDDPAARQRVANAIKVVMANKDSISIGSSSDFDSFNKGGHLGSGTLVPVSVGGSLSSSSGSNRGGKSLNIPAVMKANQDFYKVLDELKPGKEREYLSLALSTMESAPGMKQATQGPNASSSMANIKNIQASLFPIAGISGIVSSADYRRQLKRVANEILQYEKTAITPIDPKLKERLVKFLGEVEAPATTKPAATDDALSRFNKLF